MWPWVIAPWRNPSLLYTHLSSPYGITHGWNLILLYLRSHFLYVKLALDSRFPKLSFSERFRRMRRILKCLNLQAIIHYLISPITFMRLTRLDLFTKLVILLVIVLPIVLVKRLLTLTLQGFVFGWKLTILIYRIKWIMIYDKSYRRRS